MNCFDSTEDLTHSPPDYIIRVLAHERNTFAKSRKDWIHAAFDLKNGDSTLFDKLAGTELCDNCIRTYENITR